MTATQLRSTGESAGKPEKYIRRDRDQFWPLRVDNLLPATVSLSRWWGLELRRLWSLLLVAVVVALLTLGTMRGRDPGFNSAAVRVSTSGKALGDVGPDHATLSKNSTQGGRRTTDIQEVRRKVSSGDPSDSPHATFQRSASNSPAVVPKTHVSDVFRLVFVAGLEGSGHHYMVAANESLYDDDMALPSRDGHHIAIYTYYAPNMMGGQAKRFAWTSHRAMENMRHLAEWAASLSSPGAIEFFPIACSYPHNFGPLKVMQYVDLRRIAEAAEGEGIDFRVLYLRRSAKDMVIANTVHRKFHHGMGHVQGTLSEEELFVEYMRVLFTDIAVLQSFLSEIAPEFIVCHDWDRLGAKEQASNIAHFISPNDEIAGLVESSLVQTARKSSSTDVLPFEDADTLVSRLQRKLDTFEPLYCR